jgi:hypothetical protein
MMKILTFLPVLMRKLNTHQAKDIANSSAKMAMKNTKDLCFLVILAIAWDLKIPQQVRNDN